MEGAEAFVGSRVEQHRGLFKLRYAMVHGVVTDWADMERIWSYVYSKEQLNIHSEEHPVRFFNHYFNQSSCFSSDTTTGRFC